MFNQFKRVWPNRIHSLCDEYSNQMKRQADEKAAGQQLCLEIRGCAGHDKEMNRSVKPTLKTATAKRQTPRAWQRMLSGRRLDIIDPSPMDIEIEDIAHGLARVSRWNGQTKGKFPLSVAQHSVIVEKLLHANAPHFDQKWQLATLLHDAPEYVIGDMITPFKAVLGDHYRQIESKLDAAVRIRFGLPATLPDYVSKAIKRADRMAAWLEATQLAGFSEEDANKLFPKPRGTPATMRIRPRPPAEAASQFLRRFDILGGYRK
jgi:5'-deoxynucleotidase YfbR-like HD superfamily hydrolase